MRLEISSRTGRFNMCSNEESISCNICVYKDDGTRTSTNLTLESEENPKISFVEDAVYLLEDCIKRMWIDTSRGEKEALVKFLKENEDEINKGSKLHRIEVIEKQINSLQKERDNLKE